METPPELPKLSAQEKLDAVYQFRMTLWTGLLQEMGIELEQPIATETDYGTTS